MAIGKIKLAIATTLAGAVAYGVAAPAVEGLYADDGGEIVAPTTYVVQSGDSTMTVDTETLNLNVKRGDRVWYSGKLADEDAEDESQWAKTLEEGVTVGYFTKTTGSPKHYEKPMSGLNAKVTFVKKNDGFDAKINCRKIAVSFTLEVRLNDNKLKVRVPFESISETKPDETVLEYLVVYPYFDSSHNTVDGEILIPDGSGALIDLSERTSAMKAYSARVFDGDYGIAAPTVTPNKPEIASAPMYAFMYRDGGTLVTADSGAEYCKINALVSGMEETWYNRAFFNWIYREEFTKYYDSGDAEAKVNGNVTCQDSPNAFTLEQTMTLIDGDCDIADVADEYRKTLDFKSDAVKENAAGLRLEFLMAENKRGMFGDEVVTMTTTDFISGVADEVTTYCKNLSVSALGYSRGGLNKSYPNHFPLDWGPGGKGDYGKLSTKLKNSGADFAFVTDYARSYVDASVNEKLLALNMSNQFITISDSMAGSTAKYRLLNPADGMARLNDDLKLIKELGANIDYSSIGSMLYSGYETRNYNRAEAAKIYGEAVRNAGVKANVVKPNSYMWGVCDGYLDAPIAASGFMIESESVPFIQMVLSGKIPFYSRAVNLNYTGREFVLRLIDYNVYPSFLLTQKDAIELYGTNSSGIFTSSYGVWKDDIKKIYSEVDGVLSAVVGERMTKRYRTAEGAYVTEYSNGKCVAVNYSSSPITFGGKVVEGKSAIVSNKA